MKWLLFAKKYFMKKNLLFLFLGLLIGFTSCKKEGCTNSNAINFDEEAKKDDGTCKLPEIIFDITSPLQGATFPLNSTINIKGNITANYTLDGYTLKLTNTSKNEVVLEYTISTASESFSIDENWVNTVTHHSDMLLEITCVDYSDYELLRGNSINFHCHPM
jgi:hypothetical protein